MSRSDPALALRVPSHARTGRDGPSDEDKPRLRLLVERGKLGLELDETYQLGPLAVEELALSFPRLRFPVELSGGVAGFRNKRGELERVTVRLRSADVQRWARPRLKRALGAEVLHHVLAPTPEGWLVGAATERSVIAFEVVIAPLEGDLRLIPTAARGVGLSEPPQRVAARLLMSLTHPLGKAAGSAIIVERAPVELSRGLLPLAGVRAADGTGLAWHGLQQDLDGVTLAAAREAAPVELTAHAVRAVELAAMAAEAEEELLAGGIEAARRAYLLALTRAPRHLELSRRLAELDAVIGDRTEAALSTLADTVPPMDAGVLGAQLLAAVGDDDGARTAWVRAAEAEPYGPLAAACWLEAARLGGGREAEQALDEAIARAPFLAGARWRRFEEMVRRGLIGKARAEVEHLVAQAESAHERHEVLRRAAEHLLEKRVLSEASELFERALRYAPASVDAVAGLARALSLLGHRRRALELLSRASALAAKVGRRAPRLVLDLATALAEVADDRPAAIARVSTIEQPSPACYEARRLEARWRAELGDLAGASAALARLGEAAESALGVLDGRADESPIWSGADALYPSREDARRAIAACLEEGARIHELDRADALSARRLLELALRLAPRVQSARAAFRRVARAAEPPLPAAEPRGEHDDAATQVYRKKRDPPDTQRSKYPSLGGEMQAVDVPPPPTPLIDTMDVVSIAGEAEVAMAIEAEELMQRLRADPRDAVVADRLMELLEHLGKDHELLALIAARMEDGPPEEREPLVARRNAVLGRLVASARRAGREEEARVFALMMGDEPFGPR